MGRVEKKMNFDLSSTSKSSCSVSFLHVFYRTTLFLEGQQATVERVLQAIDVVQEHIQQSLVRRMLIL